MLSWNSALARRRGRKTSGASMSTARAAESWTEPVRRRSPSGTATRATDTDPSVSSTSADRNATLSTLELEAPEGLVRTGDAGSLLRRAPQGAEGRQALV